jgi:small redox-active disulfide protein 2
MKIEVLGMGCPKCRRLVQEVKKVLTELKIEAEVLKVADLDKISSYGILVTPGLVINGKVYSSGRIPEMTNLRKWIEGEVKKEV